MNEQCKELYRRTKQYFNQTIMGITEVEKAAVSMDESLDTIYALRESISYLEETRKKLEKVKSDLEVATCLSLLARHKKSWSTSHCTGTKRMSTNYSVPHPKKNPEAHFKLMDFFNVPKELVEKDLVRIHWPSFKDYCAEIEEKGENPPPGIDRSTATPNFTVTVRKKKEVLE